MSDYPPSYFAEQSGHDPDNFIDPSIFDESNLNYLLVEDEAPAYQDGLVSDQNTITEITEDDSSGHEEPQAGPANEQPHFEVDYDELKREQEAIALMLQTIAANEPSSVDANENLPDIERGPQYDVPESDDQGRAPSPQNPNPENESANHGQQQSSLRNNANHGDVEPTNFGEPREGMKNLQRTDPEYKSSNIGQSQLGLLNGGLPPGFNLEQYRKDAEEAASAGSQPRQPGFQFDFDIPDTRSDPVNYLITGGSSSLPDTVADNEQRVQRRLQKAKQTDSAKSKDRRRRPAVQRQSKPAHQASSPQRDFDGPAAGQTVENGEALKSNTPGVDSGYGTLNPSPEATDPASPGQDIDTNNEGGKKVKKIRAEADPKFDPANDLYHYPEDPKTGVRESRRREGWGRTGMRKGVQVLFNPDTEEWLESASHHSLREILIARAQAEHPNSRYLHPDPSDDLPHSGTAYFFPHENLGPDRDDVPDECFAWPTSVPDPDPEDEEAGDKGQAKKKRKRNPRPHKPDPGFWFEDNKILLDPHNNPVKKHLDIPLTLSAHTEGYKMDLIRILNASISQRDLWARMPRWIRKRNPKTRTWYTGYIGDPNTHVNMPSQRFRDEKGAIAAQDRDGSKHIREGLKEYFAEFGFDPSLTGSTRGFGRDLLTWEQDLVKLKNRGKHPDRAGKRALDEETREKNDQKLLKKIERGRKKLEAGTAKNGRASGKHPRDDQDEDFQESYATLERETPGGRLGRARGKQVSLEPQRYGTHGAPSSLSYNPDLLEAGGRSGHGTYGAVGSPFQNTENFSGNQQMPALIESQGIGRPNMSSHPRIGLQNDARLAYLQQHFSGQMWSTQGPIHSDYYPEGHYHQQHVRVEEEFPPRRDVPQMEQPAYLPQVTDDVPVHRFDRSEVNSAQYVPPQTIRKRDRTHSESGPPENSLGPGGKRRRMPGTEGSNLPPGIHRRAVKKLLKSKRDEHLPPPVVNVDYSGEDTNQAHHAAVTVEDEETRPITSQSSQETGIQEPHVPTPASAAPMPAPDIRDMPPTTEWECVRLQEALDFTRWAYMQWTGIDAPGTNRMESYNAQFRVILDAFAKWWSSGSNPERLQPREWLIQVDAWEGTVADWKPLVIDESTYECVRRGFFAPRNDDGSLQ